MKVVVFRLSSLGDVILATSFLETLPDGFKVDWVISSEFSFVLKGHPKINRLWVYDKKSGFKGWLELLKMLSMEKYQIRVDLHRTLRTRFAGLYFSICEFFEKREIKQISISKERLRMGLLLILKQRAPKALLPTPYWIRFAKASAKLIQKDIVLKKPSYLSVIHHSGLSEDLILKNRGLSPKRYFCLMPSSRWRTKEWSTESFLSLSLGFVSKGLMPVVLGRAGDIACRQLVDLFRRRGIAHLEMLNEPDFKVTAVILKNASFYLGCDTGLSHLSEAVGCKTHVIFGPTRPEIGFGPCRDGNQSISLPIGCAPCSKDGKICYRIWNPYECMSRLQPAQVAARIGQ